MLGRFPKLNTKYLPPAPMHCCHVAVFMDSPNEFSRLSKFRNDSTSKLIPTGYRYPEYKCTLQTLFLYLSQKILARIVGHFISPKGNESMSGYKKKFIVNHSLLTV